MPKDSFGHEIFRNVNVRQRALEVVAERVADSEMILAPAMSIAISSDAAPELRNTAAFQAAGGFNIINEFDRTKMIILFNVSILLRKVNVSHAITCIVRKRELYIIDPNGAVPVDWMKAAWEATHEIIQRILKLELEKTIIQTNNYNVSDSLVQRHNKIGLTLTKNQSEAFCGFVSWFFLIDILCTKRRFYERAAHCADLLERDIERRSPSGISSDRTKFMTLLYGRALAFSLIRLMLEAEGGSGRPLWWPQNVAFKNVNDMDLISVRRFRGNNGEQYKLEEPMC